MQVGTGNINESYPGQGKAYHVSIIETHNYTQSQLSEAEVIRQLFLLQVLIRL